MTQEEKAKAYDEALEKAKKLYEKGTITESLNYIFPELAESKDERIRKELIEHIKANKWADYVLFQKFSPDDVIVWLEKQESVEEIVARCKDSWYNEGKIAGMAEGLTDEEKYQQGWHDAIEKQEEKNDYENNVEPKFKVKYAGSEYDVLEIKEFPGGIIYYGIEDEHNHIDYVLPENCEIISGYGVNEKGNSYPTKSAIFSQQNPAWSEKDDYNLQCMIAKVTSDIQKGNIGRNQELIDWLNSLKGRYTWKPSEEQIDALEHFVRGIGESGYVSPYDVNLNLVHSLLNDLKKLKGG